MLTFCSSDYQTARKSVDSCRNEQDRIRKEKDVRDIRG